MGRFANGRIPDDHLYQLDTGGTGRERHVATYGTAVRWYLLRRNVRARTGVTLYISQGMNAYRDYDEQVVGRRNAAAAGNALAAASPGTSSHGGSWSYWGYADAGAVDVGNYWEIPWGVFVEECARVGLQTGLINAGIAGIEEPWHIIDADPYQTDFGGITLTRGADGVWRLEDDMTPEQWNWLTLAITNIQAYLWGGGPDVKATIGSPDSIFGQVLQLKAKQAAQDAVIAQLSAGKGIDQAAVAKAVQDAVQQGIAGLSLSGTVTLTPPPNG